MGKTKHYQSKSNRFNNNYNPQESQFNLLHGTSTQLTQLEQDLASLDTSKRLKSCMLLSDFYVFNISNKLSLNTMTTSNILNKLAMRMIDCSKEVQAHAFSALSSLTECRDALIIKKLVNIGIIRSVISISYEIMVNYINNNYNSRLSTNLNLIEDLFHILSNSLSSCSKDLISEIRLCNEAFIPLLIKLINPFHVPAQIIAVTMQLLLAISANECNYFVKSLMLSNTTAINSNFVNNSDTNNSNNSSLLNDLWKFIIDIIAMKQAFIKNEVELISTISQYELFRRVDTSNNNSGNNGLVRDNLSELKIITSIDVIVVQGLEIFANIFSYYHCTDTQYTSSLLLLPFLENVSRIDEVMKLLTEILSENTCHLKTTAMTLKDTADTAAEDSNVEMSIDDCTTNTTTVNSNLGLLSISDDFAISNRISIVKMISEVLYAIGAALHTTTSIENNSGSGNGGGTTTTEDVVVATMTTKDTGDSTNIMSDYEKLQRVMYWLQVISCKWNTIAVLAEAWLCLAHSYVLSTTITTGKQQSLPHSDSIQSTTTTNEPSTITITLLVIDGLQCMNQLVQALQYMMITTATTTECSTGSNSASEYSSISSSPIQLLHTIQSVLPPLLDLVTDTSPVANDQHTGYKLPYTLEQGITEQSFRSSLLTLCESSIEFINQYCKCTVSNSSNSAGSNSGYHLNEEDLKALCLQLVRCSTYPNIEICIPTAECISTLGQKDSNLRINAAAVSKGYAAHYFLPSSLHGLISNAILRRLQDPNAYAIIQSSNSNNNSSIDNIIQSNNKEDRMLSGSIQLMDMYINSFIDLHTSDDKEILSIYIKLKASSKFNKCQEIFVNKLQLYQNNTSICDQTNLEKYSETLENIENFVAYKTDFINN